LSYVRLSLFVTDLLFAVYYGFQISSFFTFAGFRATVTML